MKPSKLFQKILPLIGIIILLVLIKKADFSKVILNLEIVDWRYFLPILAIVFIGLALNTLKWSILIKKQRMKVPFLRLIKFNLIGQFYGVATPGRLGNFIRIGYLKKQTQKSYSQSSVSVLLDRVIDLIGLLVLSLFGILFFAKYLPIKFIYLNIGGLLTLLAVMIFIIDQKWNKKWLKIVYQRLIPEKYKEPLRLAYHSLYRDFPKYVDLIPVILMSLAIWLVLMSGSYLVIRSIDIDVGWFYLFCALPISTVVSLLPISISGWGVREASLVVLLSPFGVSIEQVLAFSVLNFFMFSIIPAFLGAIFAVFRGK